MKKLLMRELFKVINIFTIIKFCYFFKFKNLKIIKRGLVIKKIRIFCESIVKFKNCYYVIYI